MWLFLAFIAVPLIEITLFIQVGGAIGLGWTLAIVVSTAIIGTYLMRAQGALALGQIKSSLAVILYRNLNGIFFEERETVIAKTSVDGDFVA